MKGKILLILSLLFINYTNSQNLLANPGFEAGSSGVGFLTNGAGYTQLVAPFTGSTITGNFAVVNNPNTINSNFIFEGDHTTGIGKMLVVDGNTTASSFWKAGGTGAGVTGLTIGTTYRFSYWIKSVSNLGSPANISILVTGGTLPNLLTGSPVAPAPSLSWRHVVYSFVATATTATIELSNTNTAATGNDFAVDDFMLRSDLMVSVNVINAPCVVAADGGITATAFGGTPPYVNYALSGPVAVPVNATGVFTNLPPGTYSVTVTDSSLPTAATATLNNIFVGPKITVTNNTPICLGSSIALNAAGSPSGYTWTASPAATAGLTTPNVANPTVTPTAAGPTIYTVTSTVGACAPISSSVTITVNALPIVTSISEVQTICPGNRATFTITGTPNTTVTLESTLNPVPFSNTVSIGPAGTGTFQTQPLSASEVYHYVKIKGFFTLCERDLTPNALTLTVNVVPNGCATVQSDPAPGTPPLDLTICTAGECRTLQANFSPVPSTTGYSVARIPYCPRTFPDPAANFAQINVPNQDDQWSEVVPLPFKFCFYNQNYTQCNIGTNGLITFNTHAAGDFCDWPDTNVAIGTGNPGFNQLNAIFGVFQDTDFRTNSPAASPPDRSVSYKVEGVYPCRKLIVNFYHLGQWADNQASGFQTSQVILYEISNIIEVFVERRVPANAWNGTGLIGIINASGSQALAAPGRDGNSNHWSATNEAWRFTPTGPNVPVTISWYQEPGHIPLVPASANTVQVCPSITTQYTLEATYQVCNEPQRAVSTTTINVSADPTGNPRALTECLPSHTFDLTQNDSVILGSLVASGYSIKYYLTAADAAAGLNPILNPTTYSPGTTLGSYPLFAGIKLLGPNCRVVKPFNLIIANCSVVIGLLPDLRFCDDLPYDGTYNFDFTPQTAIAYGTNNPANYTITYHLSQADADTVGSPGISPINSVPGTDGQVIVVRIRENADPTVFATTTFTLHVNPIPTATISGTTTVCKDGTSPNITFTGANGIPPYTFTYTNDGGVTTLTTPPSIGNSITVPASTAAIGATTYTLIDVSSSGSPVCSQTQTGSAIVTVIALPTATISGTTTVCQNTTSPNITFTAAGGTAPYTFTYSTDGGLTTLTTPPSIGNSITIPVSTAVVGIYTYTLISVQGSGTPACSQNQTGTATVTVVQLPTATISGTTTVCKNGTSPLITFTGANGTAPYTFTYSTDGGVTTLTTPASVGNSITVAAPTTTVGVTTYTLLGVQGSGTPACSQAQTGTATITVTALPTATISGTTTVCKDSTSPNITFTGANGTAPYTFTYSTDGGVTTLTTPPSVGNSITVAAPTATVGVTTYTLLGVQGSGTPACSQAQSGTATVTVIILPTATISGTTTVCKDSISPNITFTGANGTAPYTFTYSTDGGLTTLTTPPSVGNSITVPASTSTAGITTYTLISVQGSGTPACSQNQTGAATVTVVQLPTATISGTTTVCKNGTSPLITFTGANGTAPYTFTYSTDGGVTTLTTPASVGNSITVAAPTAAVGVTTYTLLGVQGSGTPACSQAQTGTATITVTALPTATISGTTTVCKDSTSPNITFTGANGTAPYTFTYSTDGGVTTLTTPQSIGNSITVPASTATVGATTYTLLGVQSIGGSACSQAQSGTATVTVSILPTATISGTTTVCKDSTSPNITFTGANGTAPYTFTYSTDGGLTTLTTPPSVGNSITVPASTATAGITTYTLISVQGSGTPACSQNQTGTATVTVVQLPTATISGTTTVCKNGTSPLITFTGANGTAPYTFTYSTDGGVTTLTTPASVGNSITVAAPTAAVGVTTYTLLGVQGSGTPACSQAQTGTATITVTALPTATISGTTTVCKDSTSPNITFTGANGTAPYTFTYSTDGGVTTLTTPQSVGNSITVPASTAAVGATTYTLLGVQSVGTNTCSQAQSGTATVTVTILPTATISGTTTVCKDSTSPNITFTGANGTPPYTFTYSTDGGLTTLTTPPSVGNSITVPASTATAGITTYTLISVQGSGTLACSQAQSGTAIVTVVQLPTATISGTTTVCKDSSSPNITFTGANGTAPYTFTYSTDGGVTTLTTPQSVGNSITVPASTATVGATIYTLLGVQSIGGSACSQAQSGTATVTVSILPTATISGTTTVCKDSTSPNITFTGANGTAPYTFTYSTDGGVTTLTTPQSVGNSITVPASTATVGVITYTLLGVQSIGGSACSQAQSGTATVTVTILPTATISGTTTVCKDSTSPNITFTGANGTPPYTFTYSTDGGLTTLTTPPSVGNSITVPASTATAGITTYTLISVQGSGTLACSQAQSGTAIVTVVQLPTATISGTTTVCKDSSSPNITFTGANGTAPYTFNYTIDGGFTILTTPPSVGNSITVAAPTNAVGVTTYTLLGVQSSGATACSQAQTGTASVTVSILPTATISGTTSVCKDSSSPNITFTGANGTAPYTFTYSTDGGLTTLTTPPSIGNSITVPASTATAGSTTYTLISVQSSGALACSQAQSGSATITVTTLPTATISGTTTVCKNGPSPNITFTGANGVPPYTFTYSTDGGVTTLTTSPSIGNSITVPASTATVGNTTYTLINVQGSGTLACSQAQTGTATVTVNPLPTATITGTTSVCMGFPSPSITFTGANGTPPYHFNYTLNTVPQSGTSSGANNTLVVPIPSTASAATFSYDLIDVTDSSVAACSQNQSGNATVTVIGAPIINTNPSNYVVCDDSLNNDGLYCAFNLSSKDSDIMASPGGIQITYHETPDDADTGARPLSSPYCNIRAWDQEIYVRVFDPSAPRCYSRTSFHLIVNPIPLPNPTIPDYSLCDVSGAPNQEIFNLSSWIPQISTQAGVTIRFYGSLPDAQANVPSTALSNLFPNTSNPQQIWFNIQDNVTLCNTTGSFNLVVNPLPTVPPLAYPAYSLCDDDQSNIGYEVFDLGGKINSILSGQLGMDVQFYDSYPDAQNANAANEITPSRYPNLKYKNRIQYVQTIGIRITNRLTRCYAVSSMDLRVEPLPTPTPLTTPYTICDSDQDGLTCGFNLSSLIPNILQGANYTLSFYETPTDAQTGNTVTVINTSVPYCNSVPYIQTLYVRAVDNVTGCWSIMPIEIHADPSPIAPIVPLRNLTICDTDSNPQDGITRVNLTQYETAILALQPQAASNYTISYYHLQADAQGTNTSLQIIPASSYLATDGDIIWVRVENNNTHCFNVIGSFQLIINKPLPLITPTPLNICDDDAPNVNDQYHVFNLTLKDSEIIGGGPGTVTYYPSLALATAGVAGTEISTPTAYTNEPAHPAVQTLGVVVTTPAGCQSITTLDIRVLPVPTPRTPPVLTKCDDVTPNGTELFDLTVNEGYIANGDLNLTFHYFPTRLDAENNNTLVEFSPANAVEVGSNVFIRVENTRVDYQGNHCYVVIEQAIKVNPLPTVVQPLDPFKACDDNTDGIAVFNLADPKLKERILGPTQLPADYTVSFYDSPTQANPLTNTGVAALPMSYTNTSSPYIQPIYIRVENNTTHCVNADGILALVVEDYATATSPTIAPICDNFGDTSDGRASIDLDTYATAVLGGQSATTFLLTYYLSDPTTIPSPMPLSAFEISNYITQPFTDTVWVKVENSSNLYAPLCFAVAQLHFTIIARPQPIINRNNPDVHTICVNYNDNSLIRGLILDSGMVPTSDYTYEWFETGDLTTIIGTGSTYPVDVPFATPSIPRNYVVHVTNIATGCDEISPAFEVIQSGPAVLPAGSPGYIVTNPFSDLQVITVNIVGFGQNYQYSLDDGPRQDSNVFENVPIIPNPHTIHVWDNTDGVANSCEELVIKEIEIIDYPHYFTPNGDGIHDAWNVTGLAQQKGVVIYIFDRYGKLLKQISSDGPGWDGTFNGHLLPADDYWFTVDFLEPSTLISRQFRAHFTLKR